MKNIFFDMDGVLAEYRANCTEEDLMKEGYFISLKPEWNMIKALEMLDDRSAELGIKVCVLTKVYPNVFKHSVNEKLQWRDSFLPNLYDSQFIMVDGDREEKSEAIKQQLGIDINEDCILIDDYNYNLHEWQNNGGVAVKYVNGINDKNKSFVGNRLAYSMTPEDIYNTIINMINLVQNNTMAA